jgi:hypothetical protein
MYAVHARVQYSALDVSVVLVAHHRRSAAVCAHQSQYRYNAYDAYSTTLLYCSVLRALVFHSVDDRYSIRACTTTNVVLQIERLVLVLSIPFHYCSH